MKEKKKKVQSKSRLDQIRDQSTMPKNTLYVTGFTRESKAVDLAPEFEKYVSSIHRWIDHSHPHTPR